MLKNKDLFFITEEMIETRGITTSSSEEEVRDFFEKSYFLGIGSVDRRYKAMANPVVCDEVIWCAKEFPSYNFGLLMDMAIHNIRNKLYYEFMNPKKEIEEIDSDLPF